MRKFKRAEAQSTSTLSTQVVISREVSYKYK